MPPTIGSASSTVEPQPSFDNSYPAVSPAGPPPIMTACDIVFSPGVLARELEIDPISPCDLAPEPKVQGIARPVLTFERRVAGDRPKDLCCPDVRHPRKLHPLRGLRPFRPHP